MDIPKIRPYTQEVLDEILAGSMDLGEARKLLATTDRHGLSPVSFAVLSAARDAHSLLELKQLLEPTEADQETQMDQMVKLLEQIAKSQVRIEETLARHEQILRAVGSKISETQNASPPQ